MHRSRFVYANGLDSITVKTMEATHIIFYLNQTILFVETEREDWSKR